tara:strand:+ start:1384 stop:2268 length:885 start_codon:yes stop_codon:yes gene_type:complete
MELQIELIGKALGATIEGVEFDESGVVEPDQVKNAWLEHQVVVFPELNPTPDQHLALAQALGTPEVHGNSKDDSRTYFTVEGYPEITVLQGDDRADFWHTDATFRPEPPAGSLLCLREVPPVGGDTLWLSTDAAFQGLPEGLKDYARSLNAIHGQPPATDRFTHPVVARHPLTGHEILYINRGWTRDLEGHDVRIGRRILSMFFDLMEQPEYQMRWQWSPGDVVAWDNRSTMHRRVRDYDPDDEVRVGHRVIVKGEKPSASSEAAKATANDSGMSQRQHKIFEGTLGSFFGGSS